MYSDTNTRRSYTFSFVRMCLWMLFCVRHNEWFCCLWSDEWTSSTKVPRGHYAALEPIKNSQNTFVTIHLTRDEKNIRSQKQAVFFVQFLTFALGGYEAAPRSGCPNTSVADCCKPNELNYLDFVKLKGNLTLSLLKNAIYLLYLLSMDSGTGPWLSRENGLPPTCCETVAA